MRPTVVRVAAVLVALLLVLAVGATAAPWSLAATDVVTLPATADTWIDSSRPDSARGTAAVLDVDGKPERHGLVRFDTSALAGRTVVDVRLRLHQYDSSRTGGRVRAVQGDWTESTTWRTRPALAGDALATFGAVSAGSWYEVALRGLALEGPSLSLGLDTTSSDGAQWGSRESATPPVLVVTLAAQDAPVQDTVRVTPTADTWVNSASPSSWRGSAAYLGVDGNPEQHALLRFDLSAWSGREVVAARLRLHQVDSSRSGGRVQAVVGGWDEATTTWADRPALSGQVLASFGAVAAGTWYEVDLPVSAVRTAVVDLGLDSTSSDGADWASRESANPPELVVVLAGDAAPPPPPPPPADDGVTQVADAVTGSSDPTYYAANRRLAVTAGGRQLAVHGRHASGLQLAWRDPGSSWRTSSTGESATGGLLEGTGTGDWPASVAVTSVPGGPEVAWVVWAGQNVASQRTLQLRVLSDLSAPGGPRVGPVVTVDPAPGAYKADVAFERAPDGTVRGCVLYSRSTSTGFEMAVTCSSADVAAAAPVFPTRAVLQTSSSAARFGTLVPTARGMRVVARAGALAVYGHDVGTPLDQWWAGARGPAVPDHSSPAAVALASGEVLAVVEADLSAHVSDVYRFTADGRAVALDARVPGLAEPALASDGSRAWLVGVRPGDGAVVSRQWSAGSGWAAEVAETDPAVVGRARWPNPLREVGDRLRVLVAGAGAGPDQASVWASSRPV